MTRIAAPHGQHLGRVLSSIVLAVAIGPAFACGAGSPDVAREPSPIVSADAATDRVIVPSIDASADAPVDAPAPLPPTNGSGTYRVPVDDALELAPVSTFPIDRVKFVRVGDAATLDYDLPAELVGKKTPLRFEGTFDPATGSYALTGSAGTATCRPVGGAFECVERFSALDVDVEAVRLLLAASANDPRVLVSKRFLIDPIGILDFTLRVDDHVEAAGGRHGGR